MAFFSNLFIRKKNIDSFDAIELKMSEIQLHKKITSLQKEIRILENRILDYYDEAKSTYSKSEQIWLARRIDTTSKKGI